MTTQGAINSLHLLSTCPWISRTNLPREDIFVAGNVSLTKTLRPSCYPRKAGVNILIHLISSYEASMGNAKNAHVVWKP